VPESRLVFWGSTRLDAEQPFKPKGSMGVWSSYKANFINIFFKYTIDEN
jgi:hypothetical protein